MCFLPSFLHFFFLCFLFQWSVVRICCCPRRNIHATHQKPTGTNRKRTSTHETVPTTRIYFLGVVFDCAHSLVPGYTCARLPDSYVDSASLICLSWVTFIVTSPIRTALNRSSVYIVILNPYFIVLLHTWLPFLHSFFSSS